MATGHARPQEMYLTLISWGDVDVGGKSRDYENERWPTRDSVPASQFTASGAEERTRLQRQKVND